MIARFKDLAEFTKTLLGLGNLQVVAGGAGDDVYQVGEEIDRQGFGCLLALLTAQCVLATSQTAVFSMKLQHSAVSGSGFTDFGTTVATVTITDAVANERGKLELALDLSEAKRYVKVLAKANLSAASVDTADFGVGVVLGGADVEPAA